MGKCIYCGKPAGLFRRYHKECKEKHDTAVKEIGNHIVSFFENGGKSTELKEKVLKTASSGYVKGEELARVLYDFWKKAVEEAFEDGVLSEEEERRLKEILTTFSLDTPAVLKSKPYQFLEKGAFLRDLLNGKLPDNLPKSSTLPFNFQKSEKVLWVFDNVDYYEKVKKKHYSGGYSGFSVRIARGLYWRIGGFRGKPVVTEELEKVDNGVMVVTTKHIYFGGKERIFRIRLDKIIAFEPYENGIGIQRDAKSARPQYFVTDDGWFTYNLVRNAGNVG